VVATLGLELMARDHMARQVRDVEQLQIMLDSLWRQTMDPADIDGSFQRFAAGADRLIRAARSRGELSAQQYYETVRAYSGYTDELAHVPEQPGQSRANRAALHATSVAKAKTAIASGVPAADALDLARAAMLASAKRRVLDAPRRRLIALSDSDPNSRRWARVSDGKPCYFCAMLVSRGPVYSNLTGRFDAHDGCGCSAKPVFRNDPGGGWSADARAMETLFQLPTDHDNLSWRQRYSRAVADPESAVAKALADRWTLAA
jgi:hypothetical protein